AWGWVCGAEVCGAEACRVLAAGGGSERVPTASLLPADLPGMDDARVRRGRPACHVAHGEATAILAAFALLNRAYEILAEGWPDGPDAAVRGELARDLARAVGLGGMIAGQGEDRRPTERGIDFQTLEFIHSRKQGALFNCAAALGAAGA